MSEISDVVEAVDSVVPGQDSANEVIDTIDKNIEENEETPNYSQDEEISLDGASDEELQDVIEDSESTSEEVLEAKEEIAKRLSMKINGEEREFDLSSDDDIAKLREMAQKGEGADQKFQEAAKIRKDMEAFLELMQTDPAKAMKELGKDPDEFAESYMKKRIEDLQKSPEQKELESLRAEIEKEKELRQELENKTRDAEQAKLQEEFNRQLDLEITDALAETNLPKSKYVLNKISENLILGFEKNPEIKVVDIMPLVQKEIRQDIQDLFKALPGDVIDNMLGDDVSKKLRKRRIKRAKEAPQTASSIKQTGSSEIAKAKKEDAEANKKINMKDFFNNIGNF